MYTNRNFFDIEESSLVFLELRVRDKSRNTINSNINIGLADRDTSKTVLGDMFLESPLLMAQYNLQYMNHSSKDIHLVDNDTNRNFSYKLGLSLVFLELKAKDKYSDKSRSSKDIELVNKDTNKSFLGIMDLSLGLQEQEAKDKN